MSAIQESERIIEREQAKIKSAKIAEAKEAVKKALKDNDDKALVKACITYYGRAKPPIQRKSAITAPTVPQ